MVHLQSGLELGVTLGTPIGLLVKNEDQRPHDYTETDLYPRPSHADYTYLEKYGIKASSGGGRSSARETIGLFIFKYLMHLLSPFSNRPSSSWRNCGKIPQVGLWHRNRGFCQLGRENSSPSERRSAIIDAFEQ